MRLHDSSRYGQAKSGSSSFTSEVWFEGPSLLLVTHPPSCVPHADLDRVIPLCDTQDHSSPSLRELEGIVQQVQDDPPQSVGVCSDGRQCVCYRDVQGDTAMKGTLLT
jgi:hypothetical protein